jgi:hypothetical protein
MQISRDILTWKENTESTYHLVLELHKVEEDTAEAVARRTLAEELEIRTVVGEEHHIEVPAHHIAVEEVVRTRVEEEEHRIEVVGHKAVEGNLRRGNVSSWCDLGSRD